MSAFHRETDRTMAAKISQQTFHAVAITNSRRDVLNALTADAVAFFGHGPLLVTELSVSTHLTEQGQPMYLASAEFACTE